MVSVTSTPCSPRSTKSPLKRYGRRLEGNPCERKMCIRSLYWPWMSPTTQIQQSSGTSNRTTFGSASSSAACRVRRSLTNCRGSRCPLLKMQSMSRTVSLVIGSVSESHRYDAPAVPSLLRRSIWSSFASELMNEEREFMFSFSMCRSPFETALARRCNTLHRSRKPRQCLCTIPAAGNAAGERSLSLPGETDEREFEVERQEEVALGLCTLTLEGAAACVWGGKFDHIGFGGGWSSMSMSSAMSAG
mmetsp:Transcript_53187/g.113663  ORF Transcript_53187/g.113663 Transcript_53187/m.113663 type:complete len:247 (-) Transcript_53187:122-862(-)